MDTLLDPFLLPVFGGDSGYATEGDVLVDRTSDGVNLNDIWNELSGVLSEANRDRSALAALVSFATTSVADPIPQVIAADHFEEASEFGEPSGLRAGPEALIVGYDFKDYDLATRFTWKFLRDATVEQVRGAIDSAISADNRLVTGAILRRLFDNAQGANEFQHPVYPLWNADGMVPPPFAGQEFSGSTTHMFASGASVIDSADLELLITAVRSKGYGTQLNTRLLILCNPAEGDAIATFKRGEPSRPREGGETGDVMPKYDFIPSAAAPAYLTEENIVGQVAPGEFAGMPVSGSYGPAWVVQSYYLPAGYVACVATGGPNSELNPVALRQHVNPAYQGLRIIPGRDQRYPLQDSFFARGFGTGVRHRGAAAVLKVTVDSTYTPPVWS
ncbi:hypothetical protein IU487_06520 [Nocardia puris]|uniref:hypothetical protein n=1 Tax=Nocardia puris TaxID=208602 RepID=UPI0018934D93|nr:hypothetical protein [Nocardia puris]MBF6210702.1 hypothetical protein [Nocardia puris]